MKVLKKIAIIIYKTQTSLRIKDKITSVITVMMSYIRIKWKEKKEEKQIHQRRRIEEAELVEEATITLRIE